MMLIGQASFPTNNMTAPTAVRGPERRIPRWEHEHLLEAVQERLDASPE
jgi:hypothetical protein